MPSNYYKPGSHNVFCDVCGKKKKREQVRMTWDGFMACIDKGCWYPKHQNENPRKVVPDGLPVSNARERNVTYLTFPPLNKWDTAGIRWSDPQLRWDDDSSNSPTRIGGIDLDL